MDYKRKFLADCSEDVAILGIHKLQRAYNDEENQQKQLIKAAREERNYLTDFYMKLQHSDYMIKQSEIDRTSEKILQLYHPAIVGHRYPVTTYGDGNCLYRAVSTAICGHQEQHVMLRLLCALELIENRRYYMSYTFLKCEDRIVKSSYSKLLHDVVKLNTEAGIEQFYVISAVLGKPIESYYPPQYPSYYTSEPLTRRVVGRGCSNASPDICIMWSQMSVPTPPDCLVPNHFVPLVSSSVVENSRSVSIRDVDQSSGLVMKGADKGSLQSTCAMDDCIPSSSECNSEYEEMSEGSTGRTSGNVSPRPNDPLWNNPGSPMSKESESESDDGFINPKPSGPIEYFQTVRTVIHLLISDIPGLPRVPEGPKYNRYFLIDNSENVERRSRNQSSRFSIDSTTWKRCSTIVDWYLDNDYGVLRTVYLKQGQYCKCNYNFFNGTQTYVPLVPQPDMSNLISIHSRTTCLQDDPRLERRISWLGKCGLESRLALVEYCWEGTAI